MASEADVSSGHAYIPPPPPRSTKGAQTRQRLLDIAGQLFVARGYSAVTLDDVAGAAALTKGALYGHFRSKGQLLVEVVRARIAAAESSSQFRAIVDDPERNLDLMYDESGRVTRLLEVAAAAAARHDPNVAAALDDLYSDRQSRIADALADAADPATAAWLVSTITAGIGMKESAGQPIPDAARLRVALRAVIESLH
ncbi:TetR/AcrR family transcriptional regulator [Mycolicibacterium goodii]|uniref:TetR/AcrR family transcriptional regulator n=1 Tax=Mycolicibacterium goodii TaxID=134601 RepID=UPI000C26001F|nr:TetR family transcriptional regulator [Mycolicibacterium goodii]PJK18221.1 TetR family transcriptional regulator [Mycolicibacterium goodii]